MLYDKVIQNYYITVYLINEYHSKHLEVYQVKKEVFAMNKIKDILQIHKESFSLES